MPSTLSPNDGESQHGKIRKHQVGIYGWRKRCLYGFILFIFAILILNVALTIWIIRVMDFSLTGIGKLQFIGRSVRINGQAEFLDSLYASSIKTRKGQDLYLESSRDITIHARDHLNRITNEFNIGKGKVESVCEQFIVKDKNGRIRFGVSQDGVTLGSDQLNAEGLVVREMLQTPLIRGLSQDSLRLQSLTRDIKVLGPEGVEVRAPAGKIHLTSLDDITLSSKGKGIRLDSNQMYLKNLPLSNSPGVGDSPVEMYQLCVCKSNGRLFLDLPDGECKADQGVCS